MEFSKEHLHWLADIVAAILVTSLALFVGLSVVSAAGASLVAIPPTWFGLYAFVVVMSATKLYGKKIYEAVKGAGQGFLQMQNGRNG